MKKVLLLAFIAFLCFSLRAQVTVTVGSALLQNPGTDLHIPVTVSGLNAATGGIGVTGIELHISYDSIVLEYDTTLNFNVLTPVSQWFFWGNGIEYATNWLEPTGNKLNIPDNTVLFDVVFHYVGGSTQLKFDTVTCLILDSVYNNIPGVEYINGVVTQGIGANESRWNGVGVWNTPANWSNGIPGDSTTAIIETGSVTLNNNASCKSLTIMASTSLNISPNYSLTINGNMSNTGSFILESDQTGTGSLIVRGSSSGTGTNTFQQYLNFSANQQHFVSSPAAGALASVFGSSTAEKYLENTATWSALLPSETLSTGAGYKVSGAATTTVAFQGSFATGNVLLSNLSYTASQSQDLKGLNLVGNPYPSAIKWDQGNWDKTNLDKAIYTWDGYKYVSWNGLIGDIMDGIIPAMQGFYVKSHATGGALTIPSTSRLHSNQSYYKTKEVVENVMVLEVKNNLDTSHFDNAFVHIFGGSTTGFDGENDAYKLFGLDDFPQIYTVATDQSALSINTQPEFGSLPVIVKPNGAGSYKIRFKNIETFNPDQALFFEDKNTSVSFNIRNLSEYFFSSDGTLETGRFILHFQPVGLNDLTDADLLTIYSHNHTIYFQSNNFLTSINRIDLYDLTGQCLFTAKNLVVPGEIQPFHLNAGLYLVKVLIGESVVTKKLFIK